MVRTFCQTVDDQQQAFGPEWADWAIWDAGIDPDTHVRLSGIEIFRRRFTLFSKNPPSQPLQISGINNSRIALSTVI